jgi:type 1 fimbria pilin
MRKWFATGACAVALAFGGIALAADSKTVEGELIDTNCYTKGDAKGEGHKDCANKCMKSGIPAAVLVDGKAWTLTTNPAPLAQYAAETVRVTGTVNEDTQTIAPDKIEVKQGDTWKEVKMKDAHRGGSESDH